MKRKNQSRLNSNKSIKRAGIYVRVSSEEQAGPDRVSPQTQEMDCMEYCKQRGYTVVKIYRDIERYRVNGRLVEPSGTRADRPGLLEMFKDADAGAIDVILCWRQDRLVRGINRVIVELKERIKQGKVELELVKEQFNLATFEILAWAAERELEAKRDRFFLGLRARFAKGKGWNSVLPYGYTIKDGYYVEHPKEAEWLRQIFQWYADGLQARDIRVKLVEAGVPQKRGATGGRMKHVVSWAPEIIRHLLKHDFYYTGKLKLSANGEPYEVPVPVLISPELAHRVTERLAKMRTNHIRYVKHEYLCGGLVYCKTCNVKMVAVTRRKKKGKFLKTPEGRYRCSHYREGIRIDGCAGVVGVKKIEADVWQKIWRLFAESDKFERAIEERISQLQAKQNDAEADCQKIQDHLANMELERQWLITSARKSQISEKDFDKQLQMLTLEQDGLERELAEKRLLVGNRVEELMELARIYREEVKAGAEEINQVPQTPEEAAIYFKWQRRIIDRLVERIEMNPDKSTLVHTKTALDIGVQIKKTPSLSSSDPESNSSRHSNLKIPARSPIFCA